MYRLDKIEEPEVYQYEDALDHFEREPYGIFVQPKEIGEHIKGVWYELRNCLL